MRVLLVEDDVSLAQGIQTTLKQDGYTVDWVQSGPHGLAALQQEGFDVAVLDLGLPGLDGREVLKQARQNKVETPVLVLTARDAISDRIDGLDAGADDYLVKPFDVHELKARLRALIRRSAGRSQPTIELHGVVLDPASQEVIYQGNPIALSRREFVLLKELLENAGQILTRDRLQQNLYGWDDEVESNALEVHIHHLRKKLFPELIKTVRGVGYLVQKQLNG